MNKVELLRVFEEVSIKRELFRLLTKVSEIVEVKMREG